MLSELGDMHQSDESVCATSIQFDIETRDTDGDELVHKTFCFGYADEWDKWVFREYYEKRTADTDSVMDRNWQQSRHIMWHDNETPTIDVPTVVTERLQEATGADEIVMQVPSATIENEYEEVCVADD